MGKKIDKEKEEKKIKDISPVEESKTFSPIFGKFPQELWLEWNRDCEQNFNGTRYAKAWNDHLLARQATKEAAMWNYMMKLQDEINLLKSKGDTNGKKSR